MLVANDVSRSDIGFNADDNQVVLVFPGDQPPEFLPKLPKPAVARAILDRLHHLMASGA